MVRGHGAAQASLAAAGGLSCSEGPEEGSGATPPQPQRGPKGSSGAWGLRRLTVPKHDGGWGRVGLPVTVCSLHRAPRGGWETGHTLRGWRLSSASWWPREAQVTQEATEGGKGERLEREAEKDRWTGVKPGQGWQQRQKPGGPTEKWGGATASWSWRFGQPPAGLEERHLPVGSNTDSIVGPRTQEANSPRGPPSTSRCPGPWQSPLNA